MKKLHGLFILAQLVIVLALIQQPLISSVSAEENVEAQECDCDRHHTNHQDFHQYMRIHKDFYFELLTEKYAPEQAEKWKDIRSERDLLLKKLTEAKKRGELLHGDVKSKEWMEQHHFLQKQLTKAVKERDEKKIAEVLPQVFAHYEALNNEFQQRVNALADTQTEEE